MKKFLLVALCSVVTLSASAQSVDFGIHTGYNNTTTKVKSSGILKVGSHYGYMAGVFARVNLDKWYIEPSLDYVYKSVNVFRSVRDTKLRNHSVDVPVMVGSYVYQIQALKFRAYAGPVGSFLLKNMDITDIDDTILKADNMMFYARGGIGVDFWRLTFDINYEHGLKNFGEEIKTPKSYNISLGFKLW